MAQPCQPPLPLKWPGGKRWLAPVLAALAGPESNYREPFLGGGAAFFTLEPPKATLSDCNSELIDTYIALRDDPERVIRLLRRVGRADQSTYLAVRDMRPRSRAGTAARMIFLNRTAFNGLYRVNREGDFNVPYGHRPPVDIITADRLREASARLAVARLSVVDFRVSLQNADVDEFVYCDPPYTVTHNNNGFIRYNDKLFSWQDQVDLAEWAVGFAERGGRVVLSNAAHQPIERLYQSRQITRLRVRRLSRVAADPRSRGWYRESLVVSRACGTRSAVVKLLRQRGLDVEVAGR